MPLVEAVLSPMPRKMEGLMISGELPQYTPKNTASISTR
jgi:hypothetical protein